MFGPNNKIKDENEEEMLESESIRNFGPAAKILEEIFQDDENMINYAITKLDKH